MDKKYFKSVDIFKFLAAFFIADIFHYIVLFGSVIPNPTETLINISNYGGYLVEFFFFISGFFTALSINAKNGVDSITKFISKRIKRLYPQLFISVILVFIGQLIAINIFQMPIFSIGTDNIVLSFVLSILCINCGWISNHDSTSINGPTWYISVLIICYLITAIINRYCKDLKTRILIYTNIVLFGVSIFIFNINFPLAYPSCARGYMSFFMGMLMYLFLSSSFYKKYPKKVISVFLILFIFVIIFAFLGLIYDSIIISLFVAPVILFFLFIPNALDNIIPTKLSQELGKLSYSLYLINIPTFVFVELINRVMHLSLDYSHIITWLTITIVTIILSILLNDVFENLLVNKFIRNRRTHS